jgi:cyclopropane fatty-acyl-phospholipid synthase-like methyltransferase
VLENEDFDSLVGRGSQDDFGRVDEWDQARANKWVEALDLRAEAADQVRLREEILAVADVRAGNTVVEIGCGTGPLLASLADAVGAGGRVIGIEPQPVLAGVAREAGRRWCRSLRNPCGRDCPGG